VVAAAEDVDWVGDAGWEVVGDSHPLSGPPGQIAPPLTVTAPLRLNLRDLTWEACEHLIVALVREIEGAYEARIYGRRGQAQEGIDVVGFFDEQKARVYQSKHYETFTANDLKKAVEKYAEGGRPFQSDHLIVVTTADVSDKKIEDKLAALREAHADFKICLWGQQQLSEKLYGHPRIVRRFFGPATAEVFCQLPPAPVPVASSSTAPVVPDAIVRGPVAHLNLSAQLAKAEAQKTERPGEAADIYAHLAAELSKAGYTPHALHMRRLQAAALHDAGRSTQAAAADVIVMQGDLEAGEPGLAVSAASRLERNEVQLPGHLLRPIQAMGGLASHQQYYDTTLETIAPDIDTLEDDDAAFAFALTVFAEHALAGHRLDLITDRAERLARAADTAEPASLLQARLRACLADGGTHISWNQLARSARADYIPQAAALLFARHARHLTGRQEPKNALSRYSDAIALAMDTGAYTDAGNWLQSQDLLRFRFDLLERRDLNEGYRRVLTLRASGSGSVLPSAVPVRERALARMETDSFPNAAQALYAYRARSTVLGDLSGEHEAERLLARLHERADQTPDALGHYLAAGDTDGLKNVAKSLPEQTFDLPLPEKLADTAAWYRTAAYTAAAATADLLPDEQARQWIDAATAELDLAPAVPGTVRSTQAAFTALAQLASATTHQQAERLLTLTEHLLHRQPDTNRRSDDAHASILIAIARHHTTLRRTAIQHLCRAVLATDNLAALVLNRGARELAREPDIVADHCTTPALQGHINAALALVLANAGNPDASASAARTRLPLPPSTDQPDGPFPTHDLAKLSILAAVLEPTERHTLAATTLAYALNHNGAAFQRRDALHALATIAPHLDTPTRDRYLRTALTFAQGDHDGSADDDLPNRPFDRYRFNLGPATLRPDGLLTAACLAHTAAQALEVVSTARELLPRTEDALTLVQALCQLDPHHVTLDPALLASHSDQWIRVLAATLWSAQQDRSDTLGGVLAADPSRHVRQMLASRPQAEALHEVLRTDPRRSVRSGTH
jgi:hypothetical protein